MKKKWWVLVFLILCARSWSQSVDQYPDSLAGHEKLRQFIISAEFLDAVINSINSFNILVKKENYRVKIASFNNPASTDMGFSLENEIQSSLKPLLAKAKNTNTSKFSEVVSSIVSMQNRATQVKPSLLPVNPVFTSLIGLVGTLTVQEKHISRADLDSFILATSKYFVQYEKLNTANSLFDQQMEGINNRLKELQFDIREYMLDLVTILNKAIDRGNFKSISLEDILLTYFDRQKLGDRLTSENPASANKLYFPADGISTAKDITNALRKLFEEYQKIYSENYLQIRAILQEAKSLGRNINTRQVDASLKELEVLYLDSKNSDILGLRLNTLSGRLKNLVATEQWQHQVIK